MNEVDFNGMFGQQGWICPKCGRVYSPYIQMCPYCGGKNSHNTISSFDDILKSNKDVLKRLKEKGD